MLALDLSKLTQRALKNIPHSLCKESPPLQVHFPSRLWDLLQAVAQRLHEIIRAPDAICGQSVLAAASLVVQPYANISIDGREHPLSLFFLTVAVSGDRKSGVDTVVLKSVREYEKMLAITSRREAQEFRLKKALWDEQQKAFLGKCKNDQGFDEKKFQGLLDDLEEEPQPPLEPFLIIQEPTFPGLLKLYSTGRPSLGLFADEGGAMVGGHGMREDNLLSKICGLSSLWDGRPLSRIRKGDPNLLLYGRRLALHLMIQEAVFEMLLKNEQLVGQGLLARCLIAFPQTTAGDRPYNEVDISLDPTIQEFHRKISTILDRPLPLKNSNGGNELSFRPLHLDKRAKEKWISFHNEIDSYLKPEGKYRPILRTANKAAEQVLRIAGVLTLFENLEATIVTLDAIQRASVLVKFYLNEILRMQELGFRDEGLERADALLQWMKKKATEEGSDRTFSLRDILRNGPTSIRLKDQALKTLAILQSHEYVQPLEGGKTWKLHEEV